MAKVEVFSTLKEAQRGLAIYFSRNNDVLMKIVTEFQARHDVYRRTAEFRRRHPENAHEPLNPEEILKLGKNLAKGEVATSLLKLYSINNSFYGFDYHMFDFNNYIHSEPQDSLAKLAEEIQQHLQEDQNSILGISTVPLFYTILEPFTFSESTKKKVRLEKDYAELPLDEQRKVDLYLDQYVERGLTSKEIKVFVSSYGKFLN